MKINLKIILFILINFSTYPQAFDREEEFKRFIERGGKIKEIEKNIFQFQYPEGFERIFNFNVPQQIAKKTDNVDTTMINLWEIDTLRFCKKFVFDQKINLANSLFLPAFIKDLNNNSLPEIYGINTSQTSDAGPVKIFERNSQGKFDSIYMFDSTTLFVKAMGDIHRTGENEIYIYTKDFWNGKFYKSEPSGGLPINFDFIFSYHPNQINDMTFGDFDNNNVTDCIFNELGRQCMIGTYNKEINNFDIVYDFKPPVQYDFFSGFSINDYDQDGKTELVIGTTYGNLYLLENTDENAYRLSWQGSFPFPNAYMHTNTNDINGNGKPEFWIGGQDFVNGITRLQAYETNGNDSFEVVSIIEFINYVSLYTFYLQAADMNGDDREELILSLGKFLIILEFDDSGDKNMYSIYYIKSDEMTVPDNDFCPAAVYDLTGDGKMDILLSMHKYVNPHSIEFSYLLRQHNPLNISEKNEQINNFNIYQNFPNPFNNSTKLNFSVQNYSHIIIKVFDILGNEINMLANEEYTAGEHSVTWNGNDNNGNPVCSGMYIIKMETGGFSKSIKAILMK